MPERASARDWAARPATVTGDIAPARMNGDMMQAWLARAYSVAAPSMVASHRNSDDALMSEVITVRSWRSPPNAMRLSSIESAARSAAVTEPM